MGVHTCRLTFLAAAGKRREENLAWDPWPDTACVWGPVLETRLSLVVGRKERGGLRHGPLLPITLKGTSYVLFSIWKEEVGVSSCFSALKGEWLSQQSITSNSGHSSTLSGLIARFPLLELSELLPSTSLGLC